MGKPTGTANVDAAALAETLTEVAQRSGELFTEFLQQQQANAGASSMPGFDPQAATAAFEKFSQSLQQDPMQMLNAQINLWSDWVQMSQSAMLHHLYGEDRNLPKGDKRFKDPAWSANPVFDYIKQSYLLVSRHVLGGVKQVQGLDKKEMEKLEFYTEQYLDAMSPSNFAATNPVVMQETLRTGGQNLINGLRNLLQDLEKGKGQLRISMTDTTAFELGVNIATTPGKVVFQNQMMQLLQFEPSTKTVIKKPLLIVPPWINKYYILDLQPENSFIKWAVSQGHTVFVISWVNPDESMANKTFDDYMLDGPLAALDAIKQATGEDKVNAIGYCIGGTLMSATLAYMKAKGDDRVDTCTFFTTMVDFEEPGQLGVFIDEQQLSMAEAEMEQKGFFDGSNMSQVFNLLRSKDLVWSFVIHNYLMGKDPFPFDLLYWNSDSTRMPPAMHKFYLRKFYLENKLIEPGGVSLNGVDIDLANVQIPTYTISAVEDHIAPWTSTYAATQLFTGERTFVLGGSGHIAGIVNPPDAGKYCHWTNAELPQDPLEWKEGAEQHAGSWWKHWQKWVGAKSRAKKVPARVPGDGELPVIEAAPGSFVSKRLDAQ